MTAACNLFILVGRPVLQISVYPATMWYSQIMEMYHSCKENSLESAHSCPAAHLIQCLSAFLHQDYYLHLNNMWKEYKKKSIKKEYKKNCGKNVPEYSNTTIADVSDVNSIIYRLSYLAVLVCHKYDKYQSKLCAASGSQIHRKGYFRSRYNADLAAWGLLEQFLFISSAPCQDNGN